VARNRWIKPEFWTSEQVADLSPIARLAFLGLIQFCDDGGVHPASTKRLRMEIFPGDDISDAEVGGYIEAMKGTRLVIEFEHDGQRYWHVTGFKKHQRPEKPTRRYPDPPEASRRLVAEESSNGSRLVAERSVTCESVGESVGVSVKVSKRPMSSADASTDGPKLLPPVNEVFQHWQTVMGKRKAVLDPKRRRLITAALKAYDLATICASITGYTRSPHHMGQNETHTRYDSLELILRDSQHIEAGLGFGGPVRKAGPVAGPEATREYMRKVLEA
jgi:hypothetical protein